jgi:hypothetical protein
MVTSEAHDDSAKQAIHLIEVGGLSCAGGVDPFGVGLSDYASFSLVIRDGTALNSAH